MSNKLWVSLALIIHLSFVIIYMLQSYLFNQNYYFDHNNLNFTKIFPDERKYKINLLENHIPNFDTIILGASSATYIDGISLPDAKVFNHSVSAMSPEEFSPIIKNFERLNKSNLENIIIGLSFFMVDQKQINNLSKSNIKKYISEHKSLKNLAQELLNSSTIFDLVSEILLGPSLEHYYVKGHDTRLLVETVELNQKKMDVQLEKFKTQFDSFIYYSGYEDLISNFYAQNSKKEFKVFINLVSAPYMDAIINRRLPEYKKWINETINVFGEIYVIPPNSNILQEYEKSFFDLTHYMPRIANQVLPSLYGAGDLNFVILDKNNVIKYFESLSL